MSKEVIIKIEDICMIQTNLQLAKKNLKKLQKVYTKLNLIDYKKLNNDKVIYFEVWFMFMDEIIHIQKNLINNFKGYKNYNLKNIQEDIKVLMKPISVELLAFKPPLIKLMIPHTL
jgi:hypothetical protein